MSTRSGPALQQLEKPPRANRIADLFAPATVVLFAGAGGTCIGIEQAYVDGGFTDKYVDLAINHWDTAVGVHELNHPMTQHLRGDVREIDPNSVLKGRPIGYLHASPDCTHFSKARGSKPKKKEIRGLAWVVVDWAKKRRPDVITLENVEEFRSWGPLAKSGQPCARRSGQTYRQWVKALRALGYVVEDRELRACDYGAPTTRKRLFVVARCDGKEIIWPEKTHGNIVGGSARGSATDRRRSGCVERATSGGTAGRGVRTLDDIERKRLRANSGDGRRRAENPSSVRDSGARTNARQNRGAIRALTPFRTAAECIDWSIPMLSIFATPAEASAWSAKVNEGRPKHERIGVPRRPLKAKTLQRIARGLVKWVIEAKRPYIVRLAHGDQSNGGARWGHSTHSVDVPLGTVAASKDFATVEVALSPYTAGVGGRAGQSPATSVEAPMPTVTGKADRVVASATLAPYSVPRYGERDGQEARSASLEQPLPTVTATANCGSVVAATLAPFASTLNHGGEEHRAADLREPLATVTGANDARALVAALVTKHYGGVVGHGVEQPIGSITGTDHHAITVAHITKFRGDSAGADAGNPLPTITGGGDTVRDAGAAHAMGVTCAYLSHFYTSNTAGGHGDPEHPAKCITSGGQHAAVTVALMEKTDGRSHKDDVGGGGSVGGQSRAPNLDGESRERNRGRLGEVCGIKQTLSTGPASVHRDGHGERDAARGTATASSERRVGSDEAGPQSIAPFLAGAGGPSYSANPKSIDEPFGTVMVEDRRAIVAAFLDTYYGNSKDGGSVNAPAPTVVSKDRISLVTVVIDNQTYVVTDIAMRMLTPKELLLAQGFPADYRVDVTADGTRVSKADQVKLIGNAVPPPFARALAFANVVEQGVLGEPPRRKAKTEVAHALH